MHLSLENIYIKSRVMYLAKATVGDLFRSPTVGDLNFFFWFFAKEISTIGYI